MNSKQLWQSTLGELELTVSKIHFTTWLKNTFIIEWKEDTVIVAVPNNFTKAWLENKYHKSIIQVLQNITDNKVMNVEYKVEITKQPAISQAAVIQEDAATSSQEDASQAQTQETASRSQEHAFNPRYVFANFVVGKGSELAYAASVRVAKEPGTKYNPLFLYGGVGLGKTHLMLAVGNELLRTNPNFKILYITAEQFTNDYVSSLQTGTVDKFKNKYRTPDILLVDDIQFIGGKEQTQEQFFHAFNALRDAHKQIVLTSDRPPKAIPALEERLISRFEWGMIADIGSPDLETRMAILKSKAKEKGVELDEEVLRFIATNIQSNVRELEGALNKLFASAELKGGDLTIDLAHDVISSITVSQRRGGVSARDLTKVVAEYFDITLDELTGQSRRKELVVPRQITMFLMREELDSSYPTIGQELGGRDHTTAMHAYSKIKRNFDADERLRQDIGSIKQRLYNR
ncbi:chromosomal replication initiator protein DnaA [Patescibacteria group bacterium]|nr:chromosomal replication initiator protein DnaA [Patescibacteria group bacterium]